MKTKADTRSRIYAILLALGASILLYRTLSMITQDALNFLVWWVGGLLILEMLIDSSCLTFCLRWLIYPEKEVVALRLAAAATILHAIRVLIFVLGRTGPWFDFDVIPSERAMHPERWTWGQVWFASILSVLGVIAVIWIWRSRMKRKRISLTNSNNYDSHV